MIPKLLAKALGGMTDLGFHAMTLTKVAPGARTPGELSRGTNPTTTEYACRGFRQSKRSGYWQFWQNAQANGAARANFVTLSILGATLPTGVTPMAGDRIVSRGTTYTIAPDGVSVDPVDALFNCVCRAPGG